jgi:PAS domain S-box-containing protein
VSPDATSVAAELEALRARLDPGAEHAAEVDELVEGLRTTIEELQVAEAELERQNDELASLQESAAYEAERFRALFDEAPIPYLTTDRFGKIADANPAAARLLEVDLRYLIGKPFPMFVDADERRRFRAHLLELPQRSAAVEMTIRMRRRRGVAFETVAHARPAGDEIRWMLRDVTEERQHEARLWGLNRELESRAWEQAGEIAAVLDQLPLGVVIADATSGAWLRTNRRAAELLGAESVEATQFVAGDGEPVAADDHPAARAARGEAVIGETYLLHESDGDLRVVEASAAPVRDSDGTITRVVVVYQDVTARVRREQADLDFVSNAAHQLRTPLAAMTSIVSVLRGAGKDDPAALARFLLHLERETDRLARLADALLTLARAQRGEERPALSVVPLRPLLETLAERQDASVEVDCAFDLAALTNAGLLAEAVGNLVANAVDHGEGNVRISAVADGDTVTIAVADAGPGMSPDDRDRAFERFYRSSSKRGGSGLGLAIAKATVEAAGGSIELESEPGAGTTARVTLPLARLVG